jgi:hypothetical protein
MGRMGNGSVLPVGRFSPARGIVVDRSLKAMSITGTMELFGPSATAAHAATIQQSINTTWTRTFPDGYTVTCRVVVRHRGPGSKPGRATQIEACITPGPSFVRDGMSGRYMTLNVKNPIAFTHTAAHEFGHILGLQDKYTESIFSKMGAVYLGLERNSSVSAQWDGNLMASKFGVLWSQDVADVAAVNEPSPYWINDDDYVAAWVNTHPISDTAKLPTRDKLKAMFVLFGGWVSSDDVTALSRICASVTTKAEATTIRARLDLLKLTDLGQRMTIRIALAKMPQ